MTLTTKYRLYENRRNKRREFDNGRGNNRWIYKMFRAYLRRRTRINFIALDCWHTFNKTPKGGVLQHWNRAGSLYTDWEWSWIEFSRPTTITIHQRCVLILTCYPAPKHSVKIIYRLGSNGSTIRSKTWNFQEVKIVLCYKMRFGRTRLLEVSNRLASNHAE